MDNCPSQLIVGQSAFVASGESSAEGLSKSFMPFDCSNIFVKNLEGAFAFLGSSQKMHERRYRCLQTKIPCMPWLLRIEASQMYAETKGSFLI